MIALAASVVAASVLGSMHCAGMCGPLVTVVAGQRAARSRAAAYAGYHAGRLIVYAALGALAGGVGAIVDAGAGRAGMHRVAGLVAGAAIVVWGAAALSAALGRGRRGARRRPRSRARSVASWRGHGRGRRRRSAPRSASAPRCCRAAGCGRSS